MLKRVAIDLGPPCARQFGAGDAVVVVDVIRSMTTAVTAAALGARCLPVPSVAAAHAVGSTLTRPLFVGEVGGDQPEGFDLPNSPSMVARLRQPGRRPIVLLSSSGTPLVEAVRGAGAIYPGCLRNWRALADHLAWRHERVILMGAATRGTFREEDQLCCGFIAGRLVEAGFRVEDAPTRAMITRWSAAPAEAITVSKSVAYLRKTGQLDDLEFILRHVDDLDTVFRIHAGELEEETCTSTLRSWSFG
jgi:2-phosphosulfolactate phosphatase